MKKVFKLITLKNNPFGYKYNVQVYINGYYTGTGKFFKTKAQALKYIDNNGK